VLVGCGGGKTKERAAPSFSADAAAKATAARERTERIKKGEDVPGGLGKPLTHEDFVRIMREAGMTTSDLRHCERLAELHELLGDAGFKEIHREINEAKERAARATIRANLRAYRQLGGWQKVNWPLGNHRLSLGLLPRLSQGHFAC
jgi:hypothetical protein